MGISEVHPKEILAMTTYVTVAIPYVNAEPHLGYAYELVLADIYARSRRLVGDHVRFLSGTDDYSLKNVLAAERAGVTTADFVSAHAARFEALRVPLDLSLDDFIRTSTDRRHPAAVERLWRSCAARGDLYRRRYEGDYCIGCEQFYGAEELVDGCCPEHRSPVERVAEDNWFFRLSAYQEHIEALISSGELAVRPRSFRDEVLAFVGRGLHDISVSRSARRARGWGIPVPDDDSQVIYVWFDALTNYISALGFGDPGSPSYETWWRTADRRVHVIGKGILRFHAVYWPAFLASAGQPAPTHIQVHPYLTIDGQKLSKSIGGAVDPVRVVAEFGTDALRWWFARDVAAVSDTDYTTDRLIARANEDLANGLGNVVNRIATLVHRHRAGTVPGVQAEPIDALRSLQNDVFASIATLDLRNAAELIRQAIADLNRALETTKPWEIAKEERRAPGRHPTALDAHLASYVLSARVIASAAEPIIPGLAKRLLDQLGRTAQLPDARPAFARIERS
jgi:methionyl-tRNA synthetase